MRFRRVDAVPLSHPIEIPPVFGFPRARKNSEISAGKQQNYQRPLAPCVSPTPAPMTRQRIFGIWEHNRNMSRAQGKVFTPREGTAFRAGTVRTQCRAESRRSFPVRDANSVAPRAIVFDRDTRFAAGRRCAKAAAQLRSHFFAPMERRTHVSHNRNDNRSYAPPCRWRAACGGRKIGIDRPPSCPGECPSDDPALGKGLRGRR